MLLLFTILGACHLAHSQGFRPLTQKSMEKHICFVTLSAEGLLGRHMSIAFGIQVLLRVALGILGRSCGPFLYGGP